MINLLHFVFNKSIHFFCKSPLGYFLSFLLLMQTHSIVCAKSVSIEGSDLLKTTLRDAFLPEKWSANTFAISLQGSAFALDKMRTNAVDIAIIAVPEGETVSVTGYKSVPLCYLLCVVVVNKDNPLPDITLQQLGKILSEKENFTQWSELGLTGLWGERAIKVASVDRLNGMALEIAQSITAIDADIKSSIKLYSTVEEVMERVRLEPNTLGILPVNVSDPSLRVLSVSGGQNAKKKYAFSPTAENVNFGDYPLKLKFSVLFKANADKNILQVIKYLHSNEIAESLIKTGFMPILTRDREKFILELDNL